MAGRPNRVKPGTIEPTRWMLDDPQPGPVEWTGPTGVLEVDQAAELERLEQLEADRLEAEGPQFRAYDENGNVRPADERNLSELQVEIETEHVAQVQPEALRNPPTGEGSVTDPEADDALKLDGV